MKDKEKIKDHIQKTYTEIAIIGSQGGCCNSSCGCGDSPLDISETSLKLGYQPEDLNSTPFGANMGLGCGNPLSIASLKKGETVLDLGSGGGFDCFLAREQVGETGFVIGVDMTKDMIRLSRKNAEKIGISNVEFRLGEIEHLPVADSSVDVIISNCVLNLSVNKQQAFNEAYRVLKPGGRLSISDVVATAKLPVEMKQDKALIAGCIGGAEFIDDLKLMLEMADFKDIRMTPKDNSRDIIKTWSKEKNIEEFVASFLIEARK